MLSKEELLRYSRHISLQEVGLEGQTKLKQASVLVIGAGGLGCPCLQYLAAAGVGRIGIVDFDTVSVSNLQRQILYSTDHVGQPKVEAAKQRLLQLNPHIKIKTYFESLSTENVLNIFKDYDIVVDGSDNFSTRYLVNDAAVLLKKPLVFGSIFKFEGQVSVLNAPIKEQVQGPTYRCLYPEPPEAGEVPSCSEIGVLGVLPGIVGSVQANEVLKLILNIGESLIGKLWILNALNMQTQILEFHLNPENLKVELQKDYSLACDTITLNESIKVQELNSMINNRKDFILLDVREHYEYDIAHIKGSLNIPMNEIPSKLNILPKNKNIVVLCHHGIRSQQVIHFLKRQEYKLLSNVEGGIDAWSREIDSNIDQY